MGEEVARRTEPPQAGGNAPGSSLARRLSRRLLVLLVLLCAWRLLAGLGARQAVALAHLGTAHAAQPRSAVTDTRFQLSRPLSELTVQTDCTQQAGSARWALLDGSGKLLCELPLRPGRSRSSFAVGRGFAPGHYVLRVTESRAVGTYAVTLYSKAPFSGQQLRLLLALAAVLLSGGAYALVGRGRRRDRRWPGALFSAASFYLLAIMLYPLLHEGGHALAASAFGVYDPARSDWLGVHGEPHAGVRPALESLPGAVHATISFAGPLLPTLVAYLSLLAWRSRWGRRVRSAAPVTDVLWSGLKALLLVGHLGLLIPLAGLGHDGDYSGFVQGLGTWRPAGIALIVVLAVANAALIGLLVRHLLRRRAQASLSTR